jgi:hypothetical protein
MGLRAKPVPAGPACNCAERVAELETAVAALARAAVRAGHAKEVLDGYNQAIDNRHDAVVIRAAAAPTRPTQTDPNQERA